uniref:Putative secreted protein n=1 Tax=Anopheles triannulatus TaxID=58253 RepID=A0A2M4B6T2_9DIPT
MLLFAWLSQAGALESLLFQFRHLTLAGCFTQDFVQKTLHVARTCATNHQFRFSTALSDSNNNAHHPISSWTY